MDRLRTSIAAVGTPSAAQPAPDALLVFFAHQSVGDDMLHGVRQISPTLRIFSDAAPPGAAGILDTHIGRNGSPESKIHDFERHMERLGGAIDVAALKFCYCDFSRDTDVRDVAARYRVALAALTDRFAKTRFVHVTVPLTTVQTGPRALVRRLLGGPPWGAAENATRHAFNEWLRNTYPPGDVFDLAGIESVTPAGRRITFDLGGDRFPSLYAGYSDDGQHLSSAGRRAVAQAWLAFLQGLGMPIA